MNEKYLFVFCTSIFVILSKAHRELDMIKDGGYSARFCLNETADSIQMKSLTDEDHLTCNHSAKLCYLGSFYDCQIPCRYNPGRYLLIKRRIWRINWINEFKFKLLYQGMNYKSGQNLTLKYESDSFNLLDQNQIHLIFSHNTSFMNISCSNITIVLKSVICKLNVSQLKSDQTERVNIGVQYGFNCNKLQMLGDIVVVSTFNKINFLIKLFSIVIIIIILCLCVIFATISFIFKKKVYKKDEQIIAFQLENQNKLFFDVQEKTFLEYQNAVQSFNNIGKFTPRLVLSFHEYMTKIFNVKIKLTLEDTMSTELEEFQTMLLNKEMLIQWINKVEETCRIKDKCLVASFLTLFLFSYPIYLLDVIETLLVQRVGELKKKSEENLLFSRSEYMIEKIIGNWFSLCLYKNIRNGDLGKRFFNLCRSIKCKVVSGMVDMFTNKSKYSLTYDNLLLGDLECYSMTIIVQVKIMLNTMNISPYPIDIEFNNLEVEVLSLDSISQVKEKIIDKAIMTYVESEDFELTEVGLEKLDSCLEKPDYELYKLQFTKNNIKIELKDFDETSIVSNQSKHFIIVNTMKHYNIKKEMMFLLSPIDQRESVSIFTAKNQSYYLDEEITIHLQIPNDLDLDDNFKEDSRFIFNPIIENLNRDSYLFMLLATKKSLKLIIDGFIQCVTNWKPKQKSRKSVKINSTYFSLNSYNKEIDQKNGDNDLEAFYIKPVYYMFKILDKVAQTHFVNEEILQEWKCKSFIRQVWVNLIKNPDFIFSMNFQPSVCGSLKTIANLLLESCSIAESESVKALEMPIVKKLFLKDIKKKYSVWWESFVDSTIDIKEEEMRDIISDIVEENYMSKYKISSLKSLRMLSKTLLIKTETRNTEESFWKFDSILEKTVPS